MKTEAKAEARTKPKTISTIEQARRAGAGVYSVKDASGVGFKKETDTPGAGSFTVRYRLGGRRPTMGLGPLSDFSSIEKVRDAGDAAVKFARKGVNPIEERKRQKAANLAAERARQPVTFSQSAATHLAAHASSWKHKYARATWFNPIVKYAYPILSELPINDIMPAHVAAVVRAAAADGNLETGKRVQQRIRKIINGAIARGERDPLRGNPAGAELVGEIVPLKRKTVHFRRIRIDDAPAMSRALQEARERAEGHRAVAFDVWAFMIATCSRPSEALHARWSEVDFEKKLWVVPASRMKSALEHPVPLNELALGILERRRTVRAGGDNVFVGRPGSPIGYSNFARTPGESGINPGSPHSWRSVFSDWRGEKTAFPRELAEFALAHAVPGVAGDYQRESAAGRRVELMAAYARWLTGDAGAEVIDFRTREGARL